MSTLSPSGNGSNLGTGGNAAAARLIDLGKKLLEASREGDIEEVRRLVVESQAPFTSDWLGTTALHYAAQNGSVEVAEILLNGGVNRDAKTKLDRTALHLAAQSGSLGIVDLLLAGGADVNARDMLKMTPLHWAVERGHANVAERLLIAGSDCTLKNKFQLTPVAIARDSKHHNVIELFENWMSAGGGGECSIQQPSMQNDTKSFIHKQKQQQQLQQHLQQNNLLIPQSQQHIQKASLNLNPDLNQLLNFNAWYTSDEWPLISHTVTTGRPNVFRNQQNATGALQICPTNESHDVLDFDYQMALIDSSVQASRAAGSTSKVKIETSSDGSGPSESPEDKCIDLVEFEWNNLDFVPELFMPSSNDSDDGEPKVEYLMKIVETLKKENKQLRQQVEQLSTTSP